MIISLYLLITKVWDFIVGNNEISFLSVDLGTKLTRKEAKKIYPTFLSIDQNSAKVFRDSDDITIIRIKEQI